MKEELHAKSEAKAQTENRKSLSDDCAVLLE